MSKNPVWLPARLTVTWGALFLLLLVGAGVRIWLQNKEALRYLAQGLLEKSAAEAREQRWSRAAGYAAAARVNVGARMQYSAARMNREMAERVDFMGEADGWVSVGGVATIRPHSE